jgi:hypothetical protein
MLKIKGQIDNKSGNGKYKGMITLMFKSGELEVVKNWRPITLLNVDHTNYFNITSRKTQTRTSKYY